MRLETLYKGVCLLQIAKVDIESRTHLEWQEDNCYPSEPVFVASPDAVAEDDGKKLESSPDDKKLEEEGTESNFDSN